MIMKEFKQNMKDKFEVMIMMSVLTTFFLGMFIKTGSWYIEEW